MGVFQSSLHHSKMQTARHGCQALMTVVKGGGGVFVCLYVLSGRISQAQFITELFSIF